MALISTRFPAYDPLDRFTPLRGVLSIGVHTPKGYPKGLEYVTPILAATYYLPVSKPERYIPRVARFSLQVCDAYNPPTLM